MAEIATIARPYAQALYDVARGDMLDQWAELVGQLAQVMAHPEMQALAKNPSLDADKINELVLAALSVLPDTMRESLRRFIAVLLENHRLTLMPEIAAQFFALKNASQGSDIAEISSAYPIEAAQLEALCADLEKKFGKKLKATIKIDPELIGGIRVQVGDEVLDQSVRAGLARMESMLAA
mgnify:CR=1 FL=1